MNRFLVAGSLFLLVALSMVVGAFLYVQFLLVPKEESAVVEGVVEALPSVNAKSTPTDEGETLTTEPTAIEEPASDVVPTTSMPLSSLPLSDTQKSLLATAGIDYDTFIITSEMILCAKEKLGTDRFAAIVEGSSPSALETMSLLGCL
jgi:hypothetical protein